MRAMLREYRKGAPGYKERAPEQSAERNLSTPHLRPGSTRKGRAAPGALQYTWR